MRTVTDKTAAVRGEVEVQLQLRSLCLFTRVLVANIDNEFIHGMDLIWRYGLAYDSGRNTLRFENEEFLLSRSKEDPTVPIKAVETAKVPSSIVNIVFGGLDRNLGSCLGLVP